MSPRATLLVGALLLAALPARAETPLERGTYLMQSIVACGNCHTPMGPDGPVEGMELAGQLVMKDAAFTAYAGNITPDEETGIGAWSEEEIVRAIREGVRPDGSLIGPPMPIEHYRHMSDSDVEAIAAYLRNVPPVRNEVPASAYNIPLPESYGPPVDKVAEVPRDDLIAYGAYLAGPLGHCVECHTPMAGPVRDYENQLGAGGFQFPGPWGVSTSANITPHADGIAHHSDAELKTIITTGIKPDGRKMMPPMPYAYYARMEEGDLEAIIAYLRTLPPRASPR
ncbi:c-type cytochrome [Afifella pfennigii]|uniref:c-type cytochrome n=1 Tax=Afifella pfennigii TaxID=209897 RepID=UPI00047E1DBB|nr:c-type cytochrome [Afifella pfennigii]